MFELLICYNLTSIKHHVGLRFIYLVCAENVQYPTKFNSGRLNILKIRSITSISFLSLKVICIFLVDKANDGFTILIAQVVVKCVA